MVGDTSFYDVSTTIWGASLERMPDDYKRELVHELRQLVHTGGCFEDEGFIPVKCADGGFTIKPIHWFRSRDEANKLIELCQK